MSGGSAPRNHGMATTEPDRTQTSPVTEVLKAALGAGDTAGSKASGFGVMLAAIWMILEWQGGATRSEIDAVRSEMQQQRMLIEQQASVKCEQMMTQIGRDIDVLRRRVDVLQQMASESDADAPGAGKR